MSESSSTELPVELRREQGRWERLARDPYYSVINVEEYRDARLTSAARERFDRSGEEDVERTLADIRRWVDPAFHPREALDYGCGVGRLTLPLARVCERITGVDISEAMLAEARRNAAAHDVRNVRFVSSASYFGDGASTSEKLDFIHSYIVLQHVPPRAGMWITRALLTRLAPGGVGALHFTFARRASLTRRIAHRLRGTVPGVNALANLVQHRPLLEPLIPMHEYDLGALHALLGEQGCECIHVRLTDHGGHLGAMLMFRRD